MWKAAVPASGSSEYQCIALHLEDSSGMVFDLVPRWGQMSSTRQSVFLRGTTEGGTANSAIRSIGKENYIVVNGRAMFITKLETCKEAGLLY